MEGTLGIELRNVCLSIGKKVLFDDLELSLALDDKVTFVGENGCGKSTLLRIIRGADYPYSGFIQVGGRIGYLPQHFEDVDGEKPSILILLESLNDKEIESFLTQSLSSSVFFLMKMLDKRRNKYYYLCQVVFVTSFEVNKFLCVW